jgi:hypothetical protein
MERLDECDLRYADGVKLEKEVGAAGAIDMDHPKR